MKRIIVVLLAFATIFALAIPAAATTLSGTCGDNAVWLLNGDTLTISGSGHMYEHNSWGNYRSQIRKVIIEEGITSIGYCTFSFHSKLEEVVLPNSLVTIGYQAFQGCDKLVTITLPKNVSQFYSKNVGGAVASVFSSDNLIAIEVHPENQWFCDVDGVLFDKEMQTLLCYPKGKAESHYIVPYGVKELSYGAFWFAECTIDLPTSLQIIGDSAFYAAKFSNIKIPISVTEIREGAFENCDQLTNITIPISVKKVWRSAFASCDKLESITFNNPDCVIVNTQQTIDQNVIVKGNCGSTAENYAKRFGRNFVDIDSGKHYGYNLGNAGFLALLPTDISSSAAAFCNITSYSIDTGEVNGYQPNLVLETDTENMSYQEMLSFVRRLTTGCATDYSKAKVISEWVNQNMTYRFGLMGYGHTAEGVYKLFRNLEGNCECYTQLTNFMLHLAGIPNAAATSYGHCWSLALLDGRWVHIDSTNGLFDQPEAYYDDIVQIVFSPDGKLVCIIDDIAEVKLASYGLNVTDNLSVQDITIPDYITCIYNSTFSLRKRGEGNPYVAIHGTVGSYAYNYVVENLPGYQLSINGTQFVVKFHTHSIEWRSETPATCTASGTKAHYACSDCGKLFSNASGTNEITAQSLTIPASGHSYDTYFQDDSSHWRCCSCGATSAKEPHNYGAWEIITAATEESAGIRQHSCVDCGHIQTEQIPKLPHTHDMQLTSVISPTHTHPGNTQYYTCSKCHGVYADGAGASPINLTDTFIPALGHKYSESDMDSLYHWSSCSCGQTIGKEHHSFSDWEVTIAPTEDSVGTRHRICSKCGYDEMQEIPPLAHSHNMEMIAAVEATHTQEGHIAYYACTKCGNLYSDLDGQAQISLYDTTIPVLAHSYQAYQKDVENHWQVCTCGETTEPETHIYTQWTEGNTEMTRTCTMCGYTQSQLLPHSPSETPTRPDAPTEPSMEPTIPATAPSENPTVLNNPTEPPITADNNLDTNHTPNSGLIFWIATMITLFTIFAILILALLKKRHK